MTVIIVKFIENCSSFLQVFFPDVERAEWLNKVRIQFDVMFIEKKQESPLSYTQPTLDISNTDISKYLLISKTIFWTFPKFIYISSPVISNY